MWHDQTIIQAIEHEVDANGVILPGRRDVFVVPPPGLLDPDDLVGFMPPDLLGQDLVQSWILFPQLNTSTVNAASYEVPVLTSDAPVGTTRVHFQFDHMYMHDLIEGLRHLCGAPVRFAGVRNRPG
jgi:hypothetical protein